MADHANGCPLPASTEAARAWRAEFPGHCRECLGSGRWRARLGNVYECVVCVASGRCPRCGHALGDELPCRGCDWQQPSDGCPAEAACTCEWNEVSH